MSLHSLQNAVAKIQLFRKLLNNMHEKFLNSQRFLQKKLTEKLEIEEIGKHHRQSIVSTKYYFTSAKVPL